jgi:hypothetical protein
MKTLNLLTIILATQFIISCSSIATSNDAGKPFAKGMVASYISMDTNALNEEIAKRADISDIPLKIIIDLLKINSEQKELTIYQLFPSMEEGGSVIVSVIRDGYLDDSVRGEWNEFEMMRNSGQVWEIINAKKAFLCWRLESDQYQNKPCP